MSRSTRLFVFGLIAAMALVTLAVIAWRWDVYAQHGAFANRKLVLTTMALVFVPLWLGLGTLAINAMFARSMAAWPMADDQRRFTENSLIAAALLVAGIHLWIAAAVILGEPPGRAFSTRLIEAVTGIYFIINANFSTKTSPPQRWPDPGRWIRAKLRTGWVGVAAGLFILVSAIAAPVESMMWIVGGATAVWVLAAVLNHCGPRRKPA